MQKFSSFTLKIMAIIFMAMDHIYTYFSPAGVDIPIWFGYLGKLASPIFFYLIVEGFFYTRSRSKYITRVFSMGILMIGVDFLIGIDNNIFLSIGCALVMLVGIDTAKNKENELTKRIIGALLAIVFMVIGGLFTESSIFGVAMVLIFYFFRDKKLIMSILYIAMGLYVLTSAIGPNFIEAATLWDYQWMMVFAIIPILMYNGKLGLSNKFVKWMFYWFYPIHLIVIVSVAKLIAN
ncbi:MULTISPECIES: TraX family protein [Paraclostridium]|uniref:TraX family protein n=1 Tax=Paraclostridium TaxID=1849822 RepID=UPI0012432068|nr:MULTISPECIES: TraX family protein [Paraclostridium]MBZ6004405.1 conjugal transfer protein TraX [Paraclostridium bifermentans]MDU0297458.1 TraX family protein [Paraclostridium sp. MRS3W1]